MSSYDGAYEKKQGNSSQPDWVYPHVEKEETCEHKRTETWNHGYHKACLDCGKELY